MCITNKNHSDDGIPADCPGVESPEAGMKSTCQGCPNQAKCASGEMKEAQEKNRSDVLANLSQVSNIVLIMSGKGGVGKSTVATQLAYMLSASKNDVGLLDIDLTGPSIPGMTKTENAEVFESAQGWTPVYVSDKLSVMSIGHLLRDSRQSIIWRGPKKDSLIKQFLVGVDWGHLDYLIVDCPPGSSDEHITICNLLREKKPMAVLVTTPQKRCVDDVYRSASFCQTANLPIAALVENMTQSVFDSKQGSNTRELCERFNIKHIMKLDMHQEIVAAGEEGRPIANLECLRPLEKHIKATLENIKH
ncbi:Cytosolic Fe-S cluster assembly factor nubp1 [Babesia sp. Xinjiang]|uniref:Cytosolic Fe-S cluster assembly factor nubp1 n=1 Tax=Babesia sp. Xinjiang TaxID=462227 RepID=UPI000A231545|nr:Cytosolic Fe-S cluster assembly factor nubp1 [Babesia sp. Xinjiang]ORM41300.1 Cytosolic Fe-S cluster assembly factor nubp1 [Babesia sp. Xinjiang]